MHQCRDLLPVKLLAEFETWLTANGYEVRGTKADYSAYQVRVDGKGYEVYIRNTTSAGKDTVHASIYGPIVNLARKFLRERKQLCPK